MAKMVMKGTGGSKRRARRNVDRWKEKNWYEIRASPEFEQIYIGQTPAADPGSGNESSLLYRVIETSLYDFTQDFNHISIKIRFRINEVNGLSCNTIFIGHELTRDYIRSLIRRGTNRIDVITDIKTKDGAVFRITGSTFTYHLCRTSQKKIIRKIMIDILNEKASNLTYQEFVREMVFGIVEKDMKRIATEITPIRECKLIKSKLLTKSN